MHNATHLPSFQRPYTVTLEPISGQGKRIVEVVEADCRPRAIAFAQQLHRKHRPVTVSVPVEVVGRCRDCGAWVFSDQQYARLPASQIACDDCRL